MELTRTRYKTRLDESYDHETEDGKSAEKWRYVEIIGWYGIIYPYSESLLAVQISSGTIRERLLRQGIPDDWEKIQDADDGVVFTLPNKDLDVAAGLIRARAKRRGSKEAAKRLARFQFKRKNDAAQTSSRP